MGSRIKSIILSRNFFIYVLGIFIIQAVIFAIIIRPADTQIIGVPQSATSAGVAPDEQRHFGNIKFYAERSVFASPAVSHDEVTPDLLVLGEIVHFPSYLYYYVMSFPTRALYAIGVSDLGIYLTLRFITILFGVAALFVLRALLKELTNNRLVVRMTLLATVMTGAFVWLSAAINYDVPALLLFLVVLLYSVRSVKSKALCHLNYALIAALALSITKYTYIPISAIILIAAFGYVLYIKRRKSLTAYKEDITRLYKNRRIRATILLGLFLLISWLAVTKIGYNIYTYQTLNPRCDMVWARQDCLNFPIFNRNVNRTVEYKTNVENGVEDPYSYSFFGSIGAWLHEYTNSTYIYYGHAPVSPPRIYTFLLALIFSGLLLLVALKHQIIIENKIQLFVMIAALLYVVMVYVFNINVLKTYGMAYAHQGRYVLWALIIAYFTVALLGLSVLRSLDDRKKRIGKIVTLVLLSLALVLINPISSFFISMNEPSLWVIPPIAEWLV